MRAYLIPVQALNLFRSILLPWLASIQRILSRGDCEKLVIMIKEGRSGLQKGILEKLLTQYHAERSDETRPAKASPGSLPSIKM